MWHLKIKTPAVLTNSLMQYLDVWSNTSISLSELQDRGFSSDLDDMGFPLANWYEIDVLRPHSFEADEISALTHDSAIASTLFNVAPIELSIGRLSANWHHTACYEFSKKIGRFWVHSTQNTLPSPSFIPICIEAATAFGSGDHPTTQGCLHAITGLARLDTPRHALDLGCGSGILGIGLSKLFKNCEVIGSDSDPHAITVGRYNAQKNTVSLKFCTSFGFNHPMVQRPFDWIIANILATPLIQLAAAMKKRMPQYIILSGLLTRQANQVMASYRVNEFALLAHIQIEGWSTLVLKSNANPLCTLYYPHKISS